MKTAEETLAEIVHNHFDLVPLQFKTDFQKGFGENWEVSIKAMQEYANQVAQQALKDAAENADIDYIPSKYPYRPDNAIIDKESILNTEIQTP